MKNVSKDDEQTKDGLVEDEFSSATLSITTSLEDTVESPKPEVGAEEVRRPAPESFKMPTASYPIPREQQHYLIEVFAPKIAVVGVGGGGGNAGEALAI